MRCVDKGIFSAHEVQEFLRVTYVVYRPVSRISLSKLLARLTAHSPIHWLGKCQGPVAAKVDIGFFARDQEKPLVRLRATRFVIRLQFSQASLAVISGVAVAVEIHDHGSIHTHGLKYGLKGRRPAGSVLDGLH